MDLSKLSKAQLVALIDNGAVPGSTHNPTVPTEATTKRKAPKAKAKARAFTKHVTEQFTLTRDPRSDEFGVDYGILSFCDAEGNAHSGALREDDTLGKELIDEIKTYAKANAVGRARIRYNRKINAWTGRMDMFPERLRKLAGIS